MAESLFKIELGKSMADQEAPGHNSVAGLDPTFR